MGHRGLALGTALAALVNGGILFALLGRRLGGLDGRRISTAAWKISLASLVMAVAAHQTERWLHVPLPGDAAVVQALRVFGAIATALLVLALSARLLRMREFTETLRAVVRSA
jgi:putative peptidoglycan lipid II flippase